MPSNRCSMAARDLGRSRVQDGCAPAVADGIARRRWRSGLELVVDPHADQIVVPAQPGKLRSRGVPATAEIADQDDQRTGPRNPVHSTQRVPDARACAPSPRRALTSTPARTRKSASAPRRPRPMRDSAAWPPATASPPTRSPVADVAEVRPVRDLVAAGYFGDTPPSRRFLERVGNAVILPRPGRAVWWHEEGRFESRHPGDHGGLSPEEMEIPFGVLSI